MDALLTQVVISFRPLSENSVVPTVYLGGVTDNVDESCEIAAKKAAAKQDLARKAFDYLIDVCNLEIVDANYRATT
uniref:Uncharacterized protein n=1 Tax=Chenopodium quinoa TaxID=63459 RepID=A0A803N6B8_CHEQI